MPRPLAPLVWSWLARWHGWLLAALWLLIQLYSLWRHYGPHISVDSGRFLDYAQRIADDGAFPDNHILRYVGYPLFLSFWLALGAGLWGVVLGQIALSGVAVAALYRGVRLAAHGAWRPAALAAGAVVLWFDIQHFNTAILTESLFASFVMLSFWAFVQASVQPTAGRWLVCGLVLLAAGITRPNAFVVPAAGVVAGAVLLRQRLAERRFWVLLLVALAVLLPVGWVLLNKLLATFRLLETYQRGDVIFGYWGLLVKPVAPLVLPPDSWEPLPRLAYFILHNPVHFGKLAGLKLLVWLSSVKPYYSTLHNLASVVVLYPSYWLAWRGLRRPGLLLPVRVFAAVVFVGQGLVVMLTVEDWDVRFLAPVLPCVFALAALEATAPDVVRPPVVPS